MARFSTNIALFALLVAALVPAIASANSPHLARVLPRGGQRGSEVDVTFAGERLKDAQEVLFYEPGITATRIEPAGQNKLKVHLAIAPDAMLGEHALRLRCASGVSDLRTFWVGPFPSTAPAPKNLPTEFERAMPLSGNVTVQGVIENEQVHYYSVQASKGQRISAEVEGIRLAGALFDPALSIMDANRFELAQADDTPLLKQDCFVQAVAPKDGTYVIAVRESSYGGSPDSHYRLHVGSFPRPHVSYPLGGQAGQRLDVQFLGDIGGPFAQQVQLPANPDDEFELLAVRDGQPAPSPNPFRVCPFPNVLESGNNHDVANATKATMDPPLAFNGILSEPKETDYFRFHAKKGQVLELTVYARRLGSPLDSVITLYDGNGRYLAANDDAAPAAAGRRRRGERNVDSALRFTAPADGDYVVAIRDHLNGGGPTYAYRIEVTPPASSVTLAIPPVAQLLNPVLSQERQTVPVPQGNRYATLVRAQRNGVSGELELAIPDLPPGVTFIAPPLTTASEVVPVVFEAAPDAKISGKLCEVTAKAIAGNAEQFLTRYAQGIEMVFGQNQITFHSVTVDKAAVAVIEPVPFTLQVIEPKAPLVQGGELKLRVVAERKGDFKGPIGVRMLFTPPGVNAGGTLEIPADKNEVVFPLSATEGAPPRKWKIVALASANVYGEAWVASPLADLVVAAPYLGGKIQMTSIEQGQGGSVLVELEQKTKFDGAAKVQLVGLPPGVTAEPREITAADSKLVFDVKVGEKSPVGQHGSLTCRAEVTVGGDTVVNTVAKGGVLRIDPPKKETPKVASATPQPAKPAQSQEKVVSRLEKLRQEQAQAK